MLVLTRKPGEKVVIGDGIVVTVVEVTGHRVRIGIKAPDHVPILREELALWREDEADLPRQKTGRNSPADSVSCNPTIV